MDPDFIKHVRDSGAVFAGTLNTNQFPGSDSNAESFEGKDMIAPWMQYFNDGKGIPYMCAAKPATLQKRIELLKKYVGLDVNTIEHDDAAFNLSTYLWGGGCFCPDCMSGFAGYLKSYASAEDMAVAGVDSWDGFNYRDYLKKRYGWTTIDELKAGRHTDPFNMHYRTFCMLTTRTYFDNLKKAWNSLSDKPMVLVFNSTTDPYHLYHDSMPDIPDYYVGETEVCGEGSLWRIMNVLKIADSLGMPQILSPRPDEEVDVREVRQAIALTYAMGHRMLVPWDVWCIEKTERWFGTRDEYGDIYDFVRSNAALLDGYKPVSQVVVTMPFALEFAQTTAYKKMANSINRTLLQLGCSNRYACYGSNALIVHIPVNPADFDEASVIINLENIRPEAQDAAVLQECINGTNVPVVNLNPSFDFPERIISKVVAEHLVPVFSSSSKDIQVFPRVKTVSVSYPVAVHLVNFGQSESRSDIWLSNKLLNGKKNPRIQLLRPGKSAIDVNAVKSGDGISIKDIIIDVWATLAIRSR